MQISMRNFALCCFLRPLTLHLLLLAIGANLSSAVDENFATSKSANPITKLQIGVKKRVDDCRHKSSKGNVLHIHYQGTLYDTGAEFDSSYKRGTPLTFTLGAGQVIAGFDQGLLGICEGERRKLIIPPNLAYGSAGSPPTIPPDSTLVFEIECVKIDVHDDDGRGKSRESKTDL